MAIRGEKRRLGFFGERKAARFLKKNGYKILGRNFKCKAGEIDIIASKGETIAFIEVKTRTTDYFGQPNEAVDSTRRHRYCNAANQFIYLNGIRPDDYVLRFDVIEIKQGEINHIEDAFEWGK
ncbi:MAG: YraN family protein [Candidatus Coproplasma sp.]